MRLLSGLRHASRHWLGRLRFKGLRIAEGFPELLQRRRASSEDVVFGTKVKDMNRLWTTLTARLSEYSCNHRTCCTDLCWPAVRVKSGKEALSQPQRVETSKDPRQVL